MAEILQSTNSGPQDEKTTSDDTESVQAIIGKEWDRYLALVQDEDEYETPGKNELALFLMPLT